MTKPDARLYIREKYEDVRLSDEQAAAAQRAWDWHEEHGEWNEDLPRVEREPAKLSLTIHTSECDELAIEARDCMESVNEAFPGFRIVAIKDPDGGWTTTDYLTALDDVDAVERTFRDHFGNGVPIVRCTCVPQKITPRDLPMRRDEKERGIVAIWNVGPVDAEGRQRQARMEVNYFARKGYYATLATVVETTHAYGTSVDYQTSMMNHYRVYEMPAARFGKARLVEAYEAALVELAAQFARGEAKVVEHFDHLGGMPQD